MCPKSIWKQWFYAKFGEPTKCIMGNVKIENGVWVFHWQVESNNGYSSVNVNVNVCLVDRSLQGLFRINRINGIRPNACEGAHGCCHTIQVWSRSTANPARCNWLGVDFEKGGKPAREYPEKNPRSQVEIDWNSAHIRPEARVEPESQRWEARLMTTN